MLTHHKGQIIMATGAGKTYVMAQDIIHQLSLHPRCVLVVAAPRIMLAQQLCAEISDVIDTPFTALEVHSGSSDSTTDPRVIADVCKSHDRVIIFTTYHSLRRVVASNVFIHSFYCDEAHNTTRRDFHTSVADVAHSCLRSFYFTATPKYSSVEGKPGMNDEDVYGPIIAEALSPEMVRGGYILPPSLHTPYEIDLQSSTTGVEQDCDEILKCVSIFNLQRVLVCAKSTAQISNLMSNTHLMYTLMSRGYDWYVITSKHGALINGSRVTRKTFFHSLRTTTRPFALFHMKILGEGINLPNLDSCVMLRKMNIVDTLQTIGRVIRKGEGKTVGKVIYPVYTPQSKKNTKALKRLVTDTFIHGKLPVTHITR